MPPPVIIAMPLLPAILPSLHRPAVTTTTATTTPGPQCPAS
ncbi:hypothetical protein E2C01_074355 [Portunus trituberculatus]|uniref:Uncharacterized protein n=1 Tax=Portunus trituberculatus TaxID=210409 RepID=A0A5B7IDB6_PORTR|nr:hypothetical protein [Portunus trituberculatus]